jgi:hypothetical protein
LARAKLTKSDDIYAGLKIRKNNNNNNNKNKIYYILYEKKNTRACDNGK